MGNGGPILDQNAYEDERYNELIALLPLESLELVQRIWIWAWRNKKTDGVITARDKDLLDVCKPRTPRLTARRLRAIIVKCRYLRPLNSANTYYICGWKDRNGRFLGKNKKHADYMVEWRKRPQNRKPKAQKAQSHSEDAAPRESHSEEQNRLPHSHPPKEDQSPPAGPGTSESKADSSAIRRSRLSGGTPSRVPPNGASGSPPTAAPDRADARPNETPDPAIAAKQSVLKLAGDVLRQGSKRAPSSLAKRAHTRTSSAVKPSPNEAPPTLDPTDPDAAEILRFRQSVEGMALRAARSAPEATIGATADHDEPLTSQAPRARGALMTVLAFEKFCWDRGCTGPRIEDPWKMRLEATLLKTPGVEQEVDKALARSRRWVDEQDPGKDCKWAPPLVARFFVEGREK